MGDTPQYQAPPPSAAETILAQHTAAQNQQAMQADAGSMTARLMAIYGTRLAMGGQSTGSPLLSAPADSPIAGTIYSPPTVGVM